MNEILQRIHGSGVGGSYDDKVFDMLGSGPGNFRKAAVFREVCRAVSEIITSNQATHGMGDDIKFDLLQFNTKPLFGFLLDILRSCLYEMIQFLGAFDNIPAPVISELKACVMIFSIVDSPAMPSSSSR